MCCSNAFCDGDADVENFEAKNHPKLAENNANIFKQDEQQKPRTPGFRGGNNANNNGQSPIDMWP